MTFTRTIPGLASPLADSAKALRRDFPEGESHALVGAITAWRRRLNVIKGRDEALEIVDRTVLEVARRSIFDAALPYEPKPLPYTYPPGV